MQAYSVNAEVNSKFVLVMQIFGSVFVLILSLLKDIENHLGASEKMYSCGCALIQLKQELDPVINSQNPADYEYFSKQYNSILKSYESMAADDNKIDHLRARLELTEYYTSTYWDKFKTNALGFFTFFMSYIGYFIFFVASIFGILYVIFGWNMVDDLIKSILPISQAPGSNGADQI